MLALAGGGFGFAGGDFHHGAGHGDEEDAHIAAGMDFAGFVFSVDVEDLALFEGLADGDDHAAAWFELGKESGWGVLGGAGDDDDVETVFLFGPAVVTIADAGGDVFVAEWGKYFVHGVAEWLDDFD